MSLTLRAAKGSALTVTEHDANHKEAGSIGADIASATTTDLNAATGNKVNITGTTTITSFGTGAPAGTTRICRFTGALTITYNATNLILPLGVSFSTRAGDILTFQKEGAAGADGWRCVGILRGDALALYKLVQFPAVYDNGNQAGASWTFDPINGARQKVTLIGNISTWTLTAPPNNLPCTVQLDVYQDGTGSRTLSATNVKSPAGTDKVLSTGASSRDRWVLDYDGSSWIGTLMKGIV